MIATGDEVGVAILGVVGYRDDVYSANSNSCSAQQREARFELVSNNVSLIAHALTGSLVAPALGIFCYIKCCRDEAFTAN